MHIEIEYDLLLLAKLTPLKAALPLLPSESRSFARTLIARFDNHISGRKRHAVPPADEVLKAISLLYETYELERGYKSAETQRHSGDKHDDDREIAPLRPPEGGRKRAVVRLAGGTGTKTMVAPCLKLAD